MIVWINGTFGVGKTTTGTLVCETAGWRMFDPEHVGFMLAANLGDQDFEDFQDLPPWRELVPIVMDKLIHYTNNPATVSPVTGSPVTGSPATGSPATGSPATGSPVMVAVQTVLVEEYWSELLAGLTERGHSVFHVVLDCGENELRRRIENDRVEAQAKDWRVDHILRYQRALGWLLPSADLVIDTTSMSQAEVAEEVIEATRLSDSCPVDIHQS